MPADSGLSSPTVAAVVYERNNDLYATSFDGSRTVRLTATRAREWQPAVSPDGRRIAFSRGDGGISTMRVDGSHRTIWTRGPDHSPAWAPDGRTIYFVRERLARIGAADCGSIFRVSSTESARRITDTFASGHSHQDPAVSPDGRRVAFSDWDACEGGTASPRLRVVDIYGRPTRDLARLRRNGYYPDPEHSSPAWSPDGTRLAFFRNADLSIANRDGSEERRVSNGDSLIYGSPAWSPDGLWIAFESRRSRLRALLIVRPDGTGLRRLARLNSYRDPIGGWLPALPR